MGTPNTGDRLIMLYHGERPTLSFTMKETPYFYRTIPYRCSSDFARDYRRDATLKVIGGLLQLEVLRYGIVW